MLGGIKYQACACIICNRNNRQNSSGTIATCHFNISPVASYVNVNSRIVFLEERKIYKVKWHNTMPPLTFMSVINISSSSLFQVSFRSPFAREKDGPWDYADRHRSITSPRCSFFHCSLFKFRKIRVS